MSSEIKTQQSILEKINRGVVTEQQKLQDLTNQNNDLMKQVQTSQLLDIENKTKIAKDIDDKNAELQDLESKLQSVQIQITDLSRNKQSKEKSMRTLMESFDSLKQQVDDITAERERIVSELLLLNEELKQKEELL